MNRKLKQMLSGVMAVLVLSSCCTAFADKTLAENKAASEDQTYVASYYSDELSNTENGDYYRQNSTTYLTSMILSMAANNAYRLVLDSGYQDIVGSAQNASESARSIWQVMTDGYATEPWSFVLDSTNTQDNFMNMESVANVKNILRRIIGATDERLANFDGLNTPDALWDDLVDMSGGDTYTWESSMYGGGDHDVQVGDQVYFKLTAHCGASNETQSHTDHNKIWDKRNPDRGNDAEWQTAYDLDTGEPIGSEGNSAELKTVDATREYEVSFTYVGMVLSAGPEGIRCICGNLDISKIGQLGDGKTPKETGAANEAMFGQGRMTNDGNGTTKFDVLSASPEWYITVTTQFCHNVIDNDKMMESLYSTYVVPDGPHKGELIDFDINNPDLVADLMDKTGYPEEQCALLANKMRLLYMTESLEAEYGLTVAESLAWQCVLLKYTEGDFSGEGIMNSIPENRANEFKQWLESNGKEADTGTFMEFLQDSISNDDQLMAEIRTQAISETGSITENALDDIGNIMKWYFGQECSDDEIRKMFDTTAYKRGTMEGQLAKFINNLADGLADLDHMLPSSAGAGGGLLDWIQPMGDDSWSVQKSVDFIYIERRDY